MADDIDVIAVLGAGNMGHGIAEVAALAGYEVRLRDISDELVQGGLDNIEWSLGKLAENDRVTDDEADAALDRVSTYVDLEGAVADADFVVEAVPERMDVKKKVYRDLSEAAPEGAIFATNTSSLSVTGLSEETDRPGRFCGMHFFNPPVRMALVEVIAGAHTDEETLETTEALAESMGKTPVRVRKDVPGFIVNRVLVPLMNEAAWLVYEDEASMEEVDAAAKYDLGLPMGLFELADQVGVDVGLDVLEYMHEVLGGAYEPCPLIEEAVGNETLGRKTGRGFYDYDDGGPEVPVDAGTQAVVDDLLAVAANEVAKLLGADVAPVADVDEAVKLGGGWPEGPAAMADEAGLDALHDVLVERQEASGHPRYDVAEELVDRVEAGRGFYGSAGDAEGPDFEAIRVEYPGDGVGRVVLDRPHQMNTVTTSMLDELEAAMDELEADEDVRAVLVTGAGDRAFCAGADMTAFTAGASASEAAALSRRGQEAFGRFESSPLPVVAAIDGYALGGGMELATAADLRVATRRSELGQPEHNLGILPAWGGTQRLSAVVGEGRAKEIIFTAERYDAERMAEFGFVNELVDADEFESVAHEYAADLAAGPPVAQELTKRAMLAGRDDTGAGLEVEAQAFGQTLQTEDMMEGVSAFMSDRDPEFEGE
ncbi:MAG: 3-hydroxyacyl-CoA dehydrogenase NAD-binding domain-containing protein [Halobacteriaceae archaeon]